MVRDAAADRDGGGVRAAHGKLVLVGDTGRCRRSSAGGAFRGLCARLPVIELRENRRQVEAWERDALALLREGDGEEALDAVRGARPVRAGDGNAMREQLVADWWSPAGRSARDARLPPG